MALTIEAAENETKGALRKEFRLLSGGKNKSIIRQARLHILLVIVPYLMLFGLLAASWDEPGEEGSLIRTILRVLVGGTEVHIFVIGFVVAIYFYYRWKAQIGSTFKWFYETDRIRPKQGKLASEYLLYLRSYQRQLSSRRKPIALGLIIVIFMLVLTPILIPYRPISELFSNSPEFVAAVILFFLTCILWGYLIGWGSWPLIVTSRTIKGMTRRFDIVLQPGHPDGCNGLKPLGDFCLSMSTPIIVGGLALIIASIVGLLPLMTNLTFVENIIDFVGFSTSSFTPALSYGAIIFLFLVATPLLSIAFFVPLGGIHYHMVDQKRAAEDDFAKRVTELLQQIRLHSNDGGDIDQARQAKERLEIYQATDPNDIDFALWPFRFTTVLKLFSSQLVSIAAIIVTKSVEELLL